MGREGTMMFSECYSDHKKASLHAPNLLRIHRVGERHTCNESIAQLDFVYSIKFQL